MHFQTWDICLRESQERGFVLKHELHLVFILRKRTVKYKWIINLAIYNIKIFPD